MEPPAHDATPDERGDVERRRESDGGRMVGEEREGTGTAQGGFARRRREDER
jgi:hypothetical protein